MSEHTPGPWTIVEHYEDTLSIVDRYGFEHVTAESHAILLGYAEKLGIPHWADSPEAQRDIPAAEQFANARLIAAAPDLLEAARNVLESDSLRGAGMGAALTSLAAAIAKANGR